MIDWPLILTVTLVSIPLSFTPGPNNTVCTSIGASHGLTAALPFCLGVSIGFPLLFTAFGLGLNKFLHQYTVIYEGLQIFSLCFFIYLAYKIASALPASLQETGEKNNKPWGFFHGIFFQWFNVKAVFVSIGLSVAYVRVDYIVIDVIAIALVTSILALMSTITWAIGGVMISRLIKTALHFRLFSIVMAASLLLGTIPAILSMEI